jgi:hypothetical protein
MPVPDWRMFSDPVRALGHSNHSGIHHVHREGTRPSPVYTSTVGARIAFTVCVITSRALILFVLLIIVLPRVLHHIEWISVASSAWRALQIFHRDAPFKSGKNLTEGL